MRAEVSLDKAFGLCLQDAETGEDIVCTTTSSAVETGEWVGINLQKYIYEGYSLRIGKVLWRSKSMGVQKDSMSYTSSSDDVGSTGEARGGTLTFDILLSKSYFEDGAPARPSSWNATTAAAAAAASFWPWPSHVEFARVSISRASPAYESAVVLRVASRAGNRITVRAAARDAGEKVFGLGERFSSSNQRGNRLYCWAEDGEWSLGPFKRFPKGKETTYMLVPFMVSSRGHGIWLNTTRRTDWDLDSSGAGYYAMEVEDDSLDMVVITEKTPARTLEVFTGLTGRSLVPPKFQFGPWNNFFNEFDHHTSAQAQAKKFVDLDIPSSVTDYAIHFLPRGGRVVPSSISAATSSLSSLGIASLAYFNSMVDSAYADVYSEAKREGLFIENKRKEVWDFYYKGAKEVFKVGLLDFTNPKTPPLFASLLDNSTRLGFRGFMLDYGEYVDPSMRFHDGTTGEETHNAYPVQYQSAAFDYFTSLNPKDEVGGGDGGDGGTYAPPYVFYVRSGYAGTAGKTWAAWTGDPSCDWDLDTGLGAQVKAMLSAGISGMPFVGSDIGGLSGPSPPPRSSGPGGSRWALPAAS